MDNKKRNKYKELIIKTIEEIKTDIKNLEEQTKPIAPDNAIGRLSRMEAINAKSVNEKMLGNKRIRLTRLENALKKADSEEFGECVLCGEEIEENRLKLIPESNTCRECAQEAENSR